ncbi:AAA family ATPase [Rhodanobacter sp. AS-Z3]|uniref:AAA family ATPase n=1 Tax=Rhodanobacter sp. AS-Z3 TaxID=3031330 RepID=UPI00247AAFA9|nr:AAA family ATPase [Rhodanobacter sp. AS-Z3]WEN15383.1 AAA family ATPase [Rhodanobacter sp. AS-Z3]
MYQAFYKLRGKPFQLTPDAAMLFPSKGHKRAMSYLLYGLEQGEGFVMITGAVGTGKTLLIQKLFEELTHRNIARAGIASANLDGEDILPAVASAFDLPYEGRSKESLLQDVRRHLIRLRGRYSHALLVVDEAQTLTSTALEMLRILSNFEVDGQALLQVFLIGQAELQATIVNNHMEQLRQRIIASHKLDPMGVEECREYILHRLHAVGWDHDPELAPEIFPGVHQAGRGIPRKVNLIMDRLLLHGYLEELHSLDQTALNVVLDEIEDEMADVPQTLEGPVITQRQEPEVVAAPTQRDVGFTELDLKQRNNILLQLMHENIQLREMLKTAPASASFRGDEASNLDDGRSRRKHK